MNRFRTPSCSRCKLNYHLGDIQGSKIPVLLQCGHDMCRNCVRVAFKKNKQVICDVCQSTFRIEDENQLFNIPIHYYLVGKLWCLSSSKHREIIRDISNLKMTNLPGEFLKKIKKINCESCCKLANYFCHQCNETYCQNCCTKIHVNNQLITEHDIETLDDAPSGLDTNPMCEIHFKPIDFYCVTCQLKICSNCAFHKHRPHDIQSLEVLNPEQIRECSMKGETLLNKLKYFRDDFIVKLQKCQNSRSKKNNSGNDNYKLLIAFVSSVVGFLQNIEQHLLNILDQAELAVVNSINNVIDKLNNSIDELQTKLNKVNLLLKNKQFSSSMLSNIISEIENFLKINYYISIKNKTKSLIIFDHTIFETLRQGFISEIDVSPFYIMENSSQVPPGYVLTSTIEVNSDAVLPQRPSSSLSSSVSTSSCNLSAPPTADLTPVKTLDYSVKEIVKNVVEPVIITHFNSPSDFYLQLVANNSTMKMIVDELYKSVQTEQRAVNHIEMNNMLYAVKLFSNEKWYRGVVINIEKEATNFKYTVHCIDFGFTEIITSDRIRNIPSSIFMIPQLSYNCTLYGLKPSTISGWSNEAYVLFRDLMSNNCGELIMYPIKTNSERLEVDIVLNEYFYPLSIRDAMFFLGHGFSEEDYTNKALHEKLKNAVHFPESIKLAESSEYSIILSHFITPNEFYFRINDESENLLADAMQILDTLYKPTEIDSNKNYLLYTPHIGMVVAARYSIDGNWYRAKITCLPESRMVTVYYVDYGNSETLQWDQLRVLDQSLIKTPPLAIKGTIAGLTPAVDGVECTNWSEKSCIAFVDLMKVHKNIDDSLTAFVHKVVEDTHQVVLYNQTSRGEFCVNSKLISRGVATKTDPMSDLFFKLNVRKPSPYQKPLMINSRNKEVVFPTDDTLAFVKQRSVIEGKVHSWNQTSKKDKNTPGDQMSILKILSPDEITLKYFNFNSTELTERINKVYFNKNKNIIQKLNWNVNDLCALFIQKYGNWYRGKILKVNTIKQTASVNCYDLDEICDEIPLNTLYILEQQFAEEKCGILYCSMDKLVPLGTSDGKWPKYSCDRLIEALKKYPFVYLSKKGKKNNTILGEIWVRDIEMPQALEPLREHWINMNRYMIEQGLALSVKQVKKDDDSSNSKSEHSDLEIDNSINNLKNIQSYQCWLPAISPSTNYHCNALPTYVDMQCNVYFQNIDDETHQLLEQISEELNTAFFKSKPEPLNVKWTVGQMVIAWYHFDKKWYRATILKKEDDENYSVQFLDYGNIEICSHDQLRSTLYMTDIPQLCFKGFFNNILPISKNGKWQVPELDFISASIVDKPCVLTIETALSSDGHYAIKFFKNREHPNFCQYLVTSKIAYFSFIDFSQLDIVELVDEKTYEESDDMEKSTDGADGKSIVVNAVYDQDNSKEADASCVKDLKEEAISSDQSLSAEEDDDGDDENSSSSSCFTDDNQDHEYDVDTCFSKFSLSNQVVEGTLCDVVGPTQIIVMITKVDGVVIIKSKDEMHQSMYKKCPKLPKLENYIPGTAVVVLHNILWRRGIIKHDGDSVFLVDLGISIKLIQKNLRQCPLEFLELPMFTINCRLAMVTLNENADAEIVKKKISSLLKGINLKIVEVDQSDDDIPGVELYNDKQELPYKPLLDSRLLISKSPDLSY